MINTDPEAIPIHIPSKPKPCECNSQYTMIFPINK